MTSIHTVTGFMQKNRLILFALLLTAIASIPRLYHLGELGFYMDEETTAFASRAMAEGKPPQMPSGMPYHRALPHSFLNALSARVFGLNNEFSYRLPGAIIGILTIPLVFLFTRPIVGTPVAILAALLLALSEWHILTSRQARMYAPYLFFYTACVFSILRWAQSNENRHLIISIALFAITVSFHRLGVFAAFIPFIALFMQGFSKVPTYKLALFSAIGGVSAYVYGVAYVSAPYQAWKALNGIETVDTTPLNAVAGLPSPDYTMLLPGIIGALLGIWLARRSSFTDSGTGSYFRLFIHYALAILFGVLATTSNIHGAFLAILLMLFLYPGNLAEFLKTSWKPLTAIAITALPVAAWELVNSGLIPGLKSMFTFPFQYWTILGELTPGVTVLFLAALLYLGFRSKSAIPQHLYIFAICGLFPLIIVGLVKDWVPARYIVSTYPFILIISSFLLYTIARRISSLFNQTSATPATIISLLVVVLGVLGGHGAAVAYRSASLGYGDKANRLALIFPVYPDHKHPGEYVANNSGAGDVILAEDILQQQWYAERVDYWLRDPETHEGYLFKVGDHELRDIYVNSIVATTDILATLESNYDKKVWVITSGESFHNRRYYLNEAQLTWLEVFEKSHTPDFTGRDGISRVYCLNCENTD